MKSEVKRIRADVELLTGNICAGHDEAYWTAHRAVHATMLADPVTREAILAWDEKYLGEESPHKIDFSGMNDEERAAAISKAWQDDCAWPDFDERVQAELARIEGEKSDEKPIPESAEARDTAAADVRGPDEAET